MNELKPISTEKALKNVLILGSGRSGTSMIAGMLSNSGFYMGGNLYGARPINPKGIFESWEINGINEELLSGVTPKRPPFLGWFFRDRPILGQRWLSRIPVNTQIVSTASINQRIEEVTKKVPFCYKDPRFSYTLPVWKPFLRNTVFLCVFRDPRVAVRSILDVCKASSYLHNFYINEKLAAEVWSLMYQHILDVHRHSGDWLFIHYNQAFTEKGLDRLSTFLNAEVDRSFPDRSLDRSKSVGAVPPQDVKKIYQDLCDLAGYSGD